MTPSNDMREEDGGELYALPLDEFTNARDELARRLRNEGERERANRVKRLRKPSLAAWALNQVRRHDPRGVEELLAAGEQLRGSVERLLSGEDREPFERAIVEERRLVKELAREGERQLAAAGHPVTAAAQNKLVATLRAVARDSEAREPLSAGRLVRDHEVSDLGLGGLPIAEREGPTGGPEASAESTASAESKASRESKPNAADRARSARHVRSLRQRLERAQGRLQRTEDEASAAEHRVEDAQHDAVRATSALEREEARARQARASAREAGERVAELEASLAELESSGG